MSNLCEIGSNMATTGRRSKLNPDNFQDLPIFFCSLQAFKNTRFFRFSEYAQEKMKIWVIFKRLQNGNKLLLTPENWQGLIFTFLLCGCQI